jgi:murein DD-endopeptidase MepM/ murein hydrolase activator NlpD
VRVSVLRQVVVMRLESLSKLVVATALASLTAACGSDTLRFADNPFSNPFTLGPGPGAGSQRDPGTTGNVPRQAQNAIQSQPLSPPSYPTSVASAPLAAPSVPRVAVPSAPRVAAASPEALRGVVGTASGWTPEGGTAVTLKQGENIATLSNRYGVPATAILSANGLTNANQATPGRQVIIPVYNAAGSAPQAPVVRAEAPSAPAFVAPVKAKVAETAKSKTAATQNLAAQAETKTTKTVAKTATKVEPKVAAVKPEKATPVKTEKVAAAKPVVAKPEKVAVAKPEKVTPAKPEKVAAAKPEKVAPVAEPKVAAKPAADAAETTASIDRDSSDFRWPARGRVIAGFNGKSNEGINISLPEGTPVKAAEGGTVAYSGSELKGYGNLVLIRHDNGFVSAYAHNGELNVKRGEKVKRGQTIAKSGQSGNVSSPQLHFELRKGSTPVDPIQHLTGN